MRALFLAMFAACFLSGCLDEGEDSPSALEYEYMEEERDDLKQDLQEAYRELDEYDKLFEDFEELEKRAESAEEKERELQELKQSHEEKEQELRELRKEFDDYQKKYEAKVRKEAEGSEFATLEIGDRTLEGVVISSISETEVRLRHQDGFAALNSETAPLDWKERFFLRSKEEVAQRAQELALFLNPPVEQEDRAKSENKLSPYELRREERRLLSEALSEVGDKVSHAIVSVSGERAKGTGFVAQDGITIYLYTAASLLDANQGLKIVDSKGGEWRNFGKLEIARNQNIARLELREPFGNPLSFLSSEERLAPDCVVAALGINPVKGTLDKREGKVRDLEPELLVISSSVLSGKLGGPVVSPKGAVVAVAAPQNLPRMSVWPEKGSRKKPKSQAVRLDLARAWEPTSLARFLQSRVKLEEFDQISILAQALAEMKFDENRLGIDQRVDGELSIREILRMNQETTLAQQAMRLHLQLAGGKMKVSERDLNRKLRSLLETALRGLRDQTLPENYFTSFHHPELEVSREFRQQAMKSLETAIAAVR